MRKCRWWNEFWFRGMWQNCWMMSDLGPLSLTQCRTPSEIQGTAGCDRRWVASEMISQLPPGCYCDKRRDLPAGGETKYGITQCCVLFCYRIWRIVVLMLSDGVSVVALQTNRGLTTNLTIHVVPAVAGSLISAVIGRRVQNQWRLLQ